MEEQKLREISLEYKEVELVSATSNFDPSRRLGSGNYGCVYRGTLKDGHEVAIKVIEVDEDDTSGFADEVLVLSKFRHPNLVTLMGWGSGLDEDGCGRRYLVYELLEGGDVAGRLAKARGKNGVVTPFSWSERLWVALDAACGLSHMHNSTPKAFHRDIKSANILLDRSGTAKMADFGLSGIAKNKNKLNMTCEQISGTPGYACPHYIKTGKVTEATEVYAYGMVVMEMLLNTMPACMGQNGTIVYPIFQIVMPQAEGALQRAVSSADGNAQWPSAVARDVAELSLVCSAHEERRRPHFTDVGKRLRELCQEHCGGQRPAPGGAWQMQPQMSAAGSSAPSAPGATNPQMGPGHAAAGGTANATKPQMGYGDAGAGPVTKPQMGIPGAAATPVLQGANGGNVTKPQLGLGAPPGGFSSATGTSPETKPQMGVPGQTPQAAGGGFFELLGRIFDTNAMIQDQESVKEAELAEVLLECTYSQNVDVSQMPMKHKCLALRRGEQPWAVGRQQQPNFFARLVPDETTRTLISRSHVVLSLEGQALRLRKLSPNAVKLNGWGIGTDEVPITSGTQIEFCGRDNATPILGFSILLRDAASARRNPAPVPTKLDLPAPPMESQGPDGRPPGVPQSWWFSGDPGPLSLLCVSAIGTDVSKIPLEARTVPLNIKQKLVLGRMHQSGFFEHLLQGDMAQRYLCCVSRAHLEITPTGGDFEVVNLSANPIAIAGPKLGKGETALLRPGSCIDFIGTHSDGSGQTVVYLKLKLQEKQPPLQRDQSQGSEKPPTEPLLEALGGAEGANRRMLAVVGEAPFCLHLEGSAVRQGFPPEQRILQGAPQGLLVGRAHQQSLHQEALRKEVREYLSRDHFHILREKDGRYNLVALSSNPIWRDRRGQRVELEKGDTPVSLSHGDEILLFTGASDCTPDGPENLGTLKWRFIQSDSRIKDPVLDNDTIRNVRPAQKDISPRAMGLEKASQKHRYTCLGQVFDVFAEEQRHGKSPGRVTFATEKAPDHQSSKVQRPATGYIREVPPEVHELCGPDGRPMDSQSFWR